MRFIDEGEPVPRSVTAWQTLPAILREYAELPDSWARAGGGDDAWLVGDAGPGPE
jgi:hypothetical protein